MLEKQKTRTDYSLTEFKTIFLKNQILLVVQFPFEQANQISNLAELAKKNGLTTKKLSKKNLNSQFQKEKLSFLPAANSNYLFTEKNNSGTLSLATLERFFGSVRANGGIIIFLKYKESLKNTTLWYDQPRLTNYLKNQTPGLFTDH
jgi:hypothetical protein